MITAHPGNQAPPGGKHVVSLAPGGPVDLSKSLARHREGNDARLTVPPPGGYPSSVGADPDVPSGVPEQSGEALTSPVTGSASTTASTWHPRLPGEITAGY